MAQHVTDLLPPYPERVLFVAAVRCQPTPNPLSLGVPKNYGSFFSPSAKDFFRWRKYALEDAGTNKGAGVADEQQSSLIADLKQRNRSAWSVVVDRHLGEVYGFVFHLVGGDRAAAEDLNQEAWLEAIDGIDRFNAAQGAFRNWLFGIARRRVALHYRRRASAGNQTPLSDEFGEVAELGDAPILPQDVLEQVERASVVRAAMLLLPDDRRRTLLWKHVEGLSVETIAARMGKTAKATESLLSRARNQLRGLLRGYMTPCDDRRRTTNESAHE